MMLKFYMFIVFNVWRTNTGFLRCEELVPNFRKCDESVPKPQTCEESVPNPHIGETLVSNYQLQASVCALSTILVYRFVNLA